MWILFLLLVGATALPTEDGTEVDGEASRKILGSSVVTSVSVIMDTGNGSKAIFSDAVGKPVSKPNTGSDLASPINLLNPDRYEFYTFDDSGDLVKRLMTLDEIQGIVATGDSDGFSFDPLTAADYTPEKRVNDIVNNVQNVLKEEMEIHKDAIDTKPLFDTPDVSDSWSMILPAIFGNSGEDIKPEKPIAHVTPDTIMIEPTMPPSAKTTTTPRPFQSSTVINNIVWTSPRSTTARSTTLGQQQFSKLTPNVYSTTPSISLTTKLAEAQKNITSINVEIYSHSKSTTEKNTAQIINNIPIVKPPLELTKDNARPIYHVSSSTPINRPTMIRTPSTTRRPLTTVFSSTTRNPSPTTYTYLSSSSEYSKMPISSSSEYTKMPLPSSSEYTKMPLSSSSEYTKMPLPSSSEYTKMPLPSSSEYTKMPLSSLSEYTKMPTPYHSSATIMSTQTTTKLPTPTKPKITTPMYVTTTKKATTTTELPVSTEILQNSLPTLAQILHMNQGQSSLSSLPPSSSSVPPPPSSPSPISYSSAPIASSSPPPSSIKTSPTTPITTTTPYKTTTQYATSQQSSTPPLTTFTIVSSTKGSQIITTDAAQETVTQTLALDDDLNTLATEYVTPKRNSTRYTTENTLTTLPIIYYTTGVLPSSTLNKNEKTSAVHLLDKLLLTSTNIYEINTELSNRPTTIEDFDDERFDTTTETFATTSVDVTDKTDKTEKTDKTDPPIEQNTNSGVINLGDPTKQPATDKNLISSIEQLISQAVGQIEEHVINEKQNILVQSMLNKSGNKTMDDVQMETATIASNLMVQEDAVTTEQNILDDIASDDTNLLSNSVGSLLSQVYGIDNPSFTTVDVPVTTELYTTNYMRSTPLDDRKTDNLPVTFDLKTTEPPINPTTTTQLSADIDKYQEMDLNEAVVGEPSLEDIKDNPEIDEGFVPHIINITIISSGKKPAKVDLSQEEMYLNEHNKNITEEILNAEASSHNIKNNVSNANDIIETTTPEITTTRKIEEEAVQATTEESIVATTLMDKTTDGSKQTVNFEATEKQEGTTEITTQELTEIPVTTTTIAETKPSIVVTINENNLLKNISEVEESTTDMIMDEFTSSPVSTLKLPSTETISLTTINDNEQGSTIDTTISEQNTPSWTLVPTIAPHADIEYIKSNPTTSHPITSIVDPPEPVDLVPKPLQGFGLEDSTSQLDTDIYQFTQLCNELAFGFWKSVTSGISSARSVFVSPFAASSLLAMVFLGARGATSGEMNEILKLDDMVTFNPHLIFKNISESIQTTAESGVSTSAIVRELYSDRSKGPLLGFYKERAKQFYEGHVEEVSFKEIGDVIRRRTNLLVKKSTDGKINEFLKDGSIVVRSPLAGVSVNVFQTDCSQASTEGRDGELHFVVLPSIRQRRLIPVPAVVYRSGFLAGYEPSLDATAVALGTKDQTVSTILVIPGQQGIAAPGDGLARLEKRLVESSFKKGAWSRLLRALIPRPGLEVQIPRFSHRSVINATWALKKMGLKDLFDPLKADLRGLNGIAHELHFSEMIQINNFATCGEDPIGESHHSEIYPATPSRARGARYLDYAVHGDFLEEPRDYQRAFHDPLHDPSYLDLPLSLRPRQARIPDVPRLRFDRPFLYLIRHNPTGLILHMGRFNPRLLP